MMQDRGIVAMNPSELPEISNPKLTIERARAIAVVLKDVVALKPKPVVINGEQYLEYEDWQTLGQFYGYAVRTRDAVPVEINGVPGAKAQADLVDMRTGIVVGGAEAYCMRDEERWSTRTEYEWQEGKRVKVGEEPVPWFQLASMAQTRAGAKAYRNRLAWIAVLAGYKPTPAEEMTGKETKRVGEIDPNSPHYCAEHNVMWFMRGKMKSYAHPVDGSSEWCHMPKAPDKPATPEQQQAPVTDPAFDLKSATEKTQTPLTQASRQKIVTTAAAALNKAAKEAGVVFGDRVTTGIFEEEAQ